MVLIQQIIYTILDFIHDIMKLFLIIFPFIEKWPWFIHLKNQIIHYHFIALTTSSRMIETPNPNPSNTTHINHQIVTFYDCIPYLDHILLDLSWYECREIFSLFSQINHSIYLMKELSSEFRNNGINLSVQQTTRIVKLSDAINNLQLILYPLPVLVGAVPTGTACTSGGGGGGGGRGEQNLPENSSTSLTGSGKGSQPIPITEENILHQLYYYYSYTDMMLVPPMHTNNHANSASIAPTSLPSTVTTATNSSSNSSTTATSNPASTAAIPAAAAPTTPAAVPNKLFTPVTDLKCLYTQLPDNDYLHYFITKTRSQLKFIDEMSNSKKNDHIKFKFSGKKTLYSLIHQHSITLSSPTTGLAAVAAANPVNKVFDLSILKSQMKELLELLELLELEMSHHHVILSYFQFIKSEIHKPYYQLLLQIKQLPNLFEIERKISMEYDYYLLQERQYNQKICAPAEGLSPIPSRSYDNDENNYHHNKNNIFNAVGGTLTIRQSSSGMNQSPGNNNLLFKFLQILNHYQVLGNEICRLLTEYYFIHQLSSNKFYLNEINHMNNTKVLSVRQKEMIKALFSMKSLQSATLASSSVSAPSLDDYPDMKQCLSEKEPQEIEESLKLLFTHLNEKSKTNSFKMNPSNAASMSVVAEFPFDRFRQCLREYRRRLKFLDDLMLNHDFQYQYEDLRSIRLKFQRSYKKYESSLDAYCLQLQQYSTVLQHIADFQSYYCQFIEQEFHLQLKFQHRSLL